MVKPDASKRYNPFAVIPQFLMNIIFFLAESLTILLLINLFGIRRILKEPLISILLLLFLAVFETFRRSSSLSLRLYSWCLKLTFLIKNILRRFIGFFRSRSAIAITYFLITSIIAVSVILCLLKALQEPIGPIDARYSGLINTAVSLSTITLAIFFAVIVAIIQNVSKDFSGTFLKTVINDSIFISSVLIILVINIGFLSILHYGANKHIITAVYLVACYIVGIFLIMTWLTTHYLSIPNIIRTTIRKSRRFIIKIVPTAQPPLKDSVFLARIGKFERFRLWSGKWIGGEIDVKNILNLGVAKREVDDVILQRIEAKVRPIGSTLLAAVSMDREDVFSECLIGFENLTEAYIDRRKYYVGGIDRFNLFLLSQYDSAASSIVNAPNQHYSEAIATSAGRLAMSHLRLKTITVRGESNDQIGVWTGYLKKLAIGTSKLEHTTAPMICADTIASIAWRLISNKMANSAVYMANRHLEQLGTFLAKSNHSYGAVVAGRCVSGMVNQLFELIHLSSRGEPQDRIFIISLSESITGLVSKAADISRDNYDVLVSPLVSVLWIESNPPNLVGLIRNALSLEFKDIQSEIYTLRLLAEAFDRLGWIARYCYQRETTQAGWFTSQSFSEAAYLILKYRVEKGLNKRRRREVLDELLNKVVSAISDGITFAASKDRLHGILGKYSAIPALLVYFSKKYEISDLTEFYKIVIDRMIACYSGIKETEDPYWHRRRKIRSYVQLFGAWLNLVSANSELANTVIDFLKANKVEGDKERARGGLGEALVPELVRLGYPQGELFSDTWILYPSGYWQGIQLEVNELLNNHAHYRAYQSLIDA